MPLWHTLLDKNMRKEDLRVAAGLTTNMIANMGKNKGINMDTLEKICDALQCEITDVIELTDNRQDSAGKTGGGELCRNNRTLNGKNHGEMNT